MAESKKPKMVTPADLQKKIGGTSKQKMQSGGAVQQQKITVPSDPEEFEKQFGFDKRKTNVLICTPCYGGLLYNSYFHSFIKTMQFLSKVGIGFGVKTIGNESLITRARNSCVAYFLSHPEYSHMLFIDADITWQPESILKLLEADKDVISAVYPKKGYNFGKLKPLVSNDPEWHDKVNTKILDYVVNFESQQLRVEKNCIKVKDAPTGFMLIKRQTFDVLKKKYPDLKYTNDLENLNPKDYKPENFWLFFDCIKDKSDGRYLSEDYAFCRIVQDAGMSCWIEITCPLSHTGTHTFDGNFLNTLNFEQ